MNKNLRTIQAGFEEWKTLKATIQSYIDEYNKSIENTDTYNTEVFGGAYEVPQKIDFDMLDKLSDSENASE